MLGAGEKKKKKFGLFISVLGVRGVHLVILYDLK